MNEEEQATKPLGNTLRRHVTHCVNTLRKHIIAGAAAALNTNPLPLPRPHTPRRVKNGKSAVHMSHAGPSFNDECKIATVALFVGGVAFRFPLCGSPKLLLIAHLLHAMADDAALCLLTLLTLLACVC